MKPRSALILEYLDGRGQASYEELSELLGISTMTARREVTALENQGLVLKTLGGVRSTPRSPNPLYESHIRQRLSENRAEKRAIAEAVPTLLAGASNVFLDGGTTILELARVLSLRGLNLRFVTNSLLVCGELVSGGLDRVTMVGGNFCPESASFTGQLAEENAKSFYYDVAVFSTKGVVTGEGTFESSPENFRVKQLVAPRATKVILLADHSKFGVRALRKVLDFSAIHCVVTDDGTPMSAVKKMQACGVEVIVAGAKTPVACV